MPVELVSAAAVPSGTHAGAERVSPVPNVAHWCERFMFRNEGLAELREWHDSAETRREVRLPSGLVVLVVLCGRSTLNLGASQASISLGESRAHVYAVREDTHAIRQLGAGFGQEILLALPMRIACGVLGDYAGGVLRTPWSEYVGPNVAGKAILPLSESVTVSARRLFAFIADDPTRNAVREARAWLLVCELLAELKFGNHAPAALNTKPRINGRTRMLVERAANLLQNRPYDKHTLQSVARAVGLSRSALAEAFRRHHDTTLNAFLRRERMKRAELLLESGELSISEIAASVGYGDPSSFTRAFRRFRETTPRKLRGEGLCAGAVTT